MPNEVSESAPSQVTAEEQARKWIYALPHLASCWHVISGAQCDCREKAIESLTRLVSASKREGAVEAHEQDARAGCSFCRRSDIYEPAVKQMTRRGGLRWRHVTSDGDTWLCERPEVWDALSELRSKGGAEPEGGGR